MDLSKLGRTEQVLSGAGVLLFIISFLPWFEVSEDGAGWHADAWSWPSGFNDWFPILLLFLYAIVLALPAFGVVVRVTALEKGANRALVGLALSGFALLLVAIQGMTYPGSGFGYSAGPAWAYFIGLIIILGTVAESYLGFTRQGGSFARIGAALQGQGQGQGQPGDPRQAPTQQMYQQGYPGQQPPYQGSYPGQAGGGQQYPAPQGSYPPPQPPYPQQPAGQPPYPGVPPQQPAQGQQQPPYPGQPPQPPQPQPPYPGQPQPPYPGRQPLPPPQPPYPGTPPPQDGRQ